MKAIDNRGRTSLAEGLTQDETAARLGMVGARRAATIFMAERGAIRKLWRLKQLRHRLRLYERAGVFAPIGGPR